MSLMIGSNCRASIFPSLAIWFMRVRLALTVANSAATYRALINTSSVIVRTVINIDFLYYYSRLSWNGLRDMFARIFAGFHCT